MPFKSSANMIFVSLNGKGFNMVFAFLVVQKAHPNMPRQFVFPMKFHSLLSIVTDSDIASLGEESNTDDITTITHGLKLESNGLSVGQAGPCRVFFEPALNISWLALSGPKAFDGLHNLCPSPAPCGPGLA